MRDRDAPSTIINAMTSSLGECIQVVVRCRPFNDKEKRENRKGIIDVNIADRQIAIKNDDTTNKSFTFDAVYNENTQQKLFYEESCFNLVENVLEGFNATIFAYGQTGCGKSWTMQGANTSELQGVIPNSFSHIFAHIDATKDKQFRVHCSYLEIYNEEIRDLLADPKATIKCEVHEDPSKGVFVRNLTDTFVNSVQDLELILDQGLQNRTIGSTLMNDASSRSHSIFSIIIEMRSTDDSGKECIRTGKLNLVDLAGSERQKKTGATGQQLKEGTKINLSLSALGNVISALSEGKGKHIPYRDSKLTRLLQDSLGGNTKTLMVAAISPADYNYEETLSTLRYANRAKNIQNKPTINEDPKDTQLREFKDEIDRLKRLLAAQTGVNMIDGVNTVEVSTDKTTVYKSNGSADRSADSTSGSILPVDLNDEGKMITTHTEDCNTTNDPTQLSINQTDAQNVEQESQVCSTDAYKERKQRARRRKETQQLEENMRVQLTEEVGELQLAVSDGQTQLDIVEERLIRSKRRHEKRIKALECELDELRDEMSYQRQNSQDLLTQETRTMQLYEELCRAAIGSRELNRVLDKCRYDEEAEIWLIPYVCQQSTDTLNLSNIEDGVASISLYDRRADNLDCTSSTDSQCNTRSKSDVLVDNNNSSSNSSLPLLNVAKKASLKITNEDRHYSYAASYMNTNAVSQVQQDQSRHKLPLLSTSKLNKENKDSVSEVLANINMNNDDEATDALKKLKKKKDKKKTLSSKDTKIDSQSALLTEWGFANDDIPGNDTDQIIVTTNDHTKSSSHTSDTVVNTTILPDTKPSRNNKSLASSKGSNQSNVNINQTRLPLI